MKRINKMWVKESGGKHLMHRTEWGFTWTPEFDENGEVTNADQLQAYMDELNMSPETRENFASALTEFYEKGGEVAVTRSTRRFSFGFRRRK